MTFEPVTRWTVRCDGDTTHGQCLDHHLYPDDEDWDGDSERQYPDELGNGAGAWVLTLFDAPELTDVDRRGLRLSGWLPLRDGRVLCPRHVASLEYLAHAAVDGLPFDDEGVA